MSTSSQCVLVTGGTGFIGQALVSSLLKRGDEVIVLSRRPAPTTSATRLRHVRSLDELEPSQTLHAIVNLAGESLAAGRWNPARKQLFIDSRVQTTQNIKDLILRLAHAPDVLVSGSAIGWYGSRGDCELTESAAAQACYSHKLCSAWEHEADLISRLGVRTCLLRIGVVLGAEGGALQELRQSFKFKVAAQLGDGQQWMSWIHLDDLVGIILFLIDNQQIEGVVNGTAPTPVTNREFTGALANQLKPWVRLSVPAGLMSALVGEMADELLLAGQRVIPQKALAAGFRFSYSQIDRALADLLG